MPILKRPASMKAMAPKAKSQAKAKGKSKSRAKAMAKGANYIIKWVVDPTTSSSGSSSDRQQQQQQQKQQRRKFWVCDLHGPGFPEVGYPTLDTFVLPRSIVREFNRVSRDLDDWTAFKVVIRSGSSSSSSSGTIVQIEGARELQVDRCAIESFMRSQ